MFYGLCAAVRWPRSHPGATQPVQDSGAHGPCQNPIAPHLQSINASHSRSPYSLAHTASDSHTPPFHSLSHWLSHPLMFYFNFQILCIPPFFFLTFLWLLPPTTSGFIQAEHQLVLPLSLTPSLPLFSPSVSLSTSNGKISHPLYLLWEPTECGGSELGTTRHSWSKQH